MKRIWLDYLKDVIDAINDIQSFIEKVDYDTFSNDKMRQNAVVRSLEIIGEAAKNIPEEVRGKYNTIPWKRMAGMRDKLIHGYFGVDLESVWTVAVERLPELKDDLEKMFAENKE